jgi:hypothetical protein
MSRHDILSLIGECRDESSLDKQIELLHQINQSLPDPLQIKIPSLLTNDYVNRALDNIEDTVRYREGGQFLFVFDTT